MEYEESIEIERAKATVIAFATLAVMIVAIVLVGIYITTI